MILLDKDEDVCPVCGNYENLHYNYDYSKIDMPIIDIVCNECSHRFFQKLIKNDNR